MVPSTSLKVGNIVLVEAGDTIPSDGDMGPYVDATTLEGVRRAGA
jgi:high-affinity K+ transport system ATPase subunit B